MNLKGNIGTMAVHLASFLVICSCSVKEDRMNCPCILTVNTLGFGTRPDIQVSQDSDRPDETKTVEVHDLLESASVYEVKKGPAHICTYTAGNDFDITPYTITVKSGFPWGSIYADAMVTDCSNEAVTCTLQAHKQFARLKIEASGIDTDLSYSIFVHSSTSGFNLSDLSPARGEFMCELQQEARGLFTTSIPRQGRDDLELLLLKDGIVIRTIPIGKSLLEKGYNWDERDLDDIFIKVDFASIAASIAILPWEGLIYDIEN